VERVKRVFVGGVSLCSDYSVDFTGGLLGCSSSCGLDTSNCEGVVGNNSTLGYVFKDNKNTNLKTHAPQNVHSRIIYNSRYIEAT